MTSQTRTCRRWRPPRSLLVAACLLTGCVWRIGFDSQQRDGDAARSSATAGLVLGDRIDAPRPGLENAEGIALAGGRLFVLDQGHHRLLIWNTVPSVDFAIPDVVVGYDSLMEVSVLPQSRSAQTFDAPRGIDSDGTRLAVADTLNGRVLIWNSIPTINNTPADLVVGQSDFSTEASSVNARRLNTPRGVHISGDRLIVADQNNHRVLIWNSFPTINGQSADIVVGQPDMTTDISGVGPAVMNQPHDVLADESDPFGPLYVSDAGNNRVLIFDPFPSTNGEAASYVLGQPDFSGSIVGTGASNLNDPEGLAATSGGTYVVDNDNSRVLLFPLPPHGNGIPFLSELAGGLRRPSGIAVDQYFAIADRDNHRVLIWDSPPIAVSEPTRAVIGQPDGNRRIPANNGGEPAARLYRPTGITSDGQRLIVVSEGDSRALMWNDVPSENYAAADVILGQLDALGFEPGAGADELDTPRGTHIVGDLLMIADTGNSRVLIWTAIPTTTSESAAIVLGQTDFEQTSGAVAADALEKPQGVWSDGVRLLVSDTGNNRVLIWNTLPTRNGQSADLVLGQPDFDSTPNGLSATGMNDPVGIAYNGQHLAIADSENARVLIWNSFPTRNTQPADVVLGQSDFVTNGPNTTSAGLADPRDVVFAGERLFVVDAETHRIMIWDTVPTSNGAAADHVVGQPDFVTSTRSLDVLHLQSPQSVVLLNGLMWVTNYSTGRVTTFDIPAPL